MIKLSFASGSDVRIVETVTGFTVMEAAVNAGIDGVDAECGGGAACGTCHVQIGQDFANLFPQPDDVESELLEMVQNRGPTSRLSCQITLSEAHDGMLVTVPHPNGPA